MEGSIGSEKFNTPEKREFVKNFSEFMKNALLIYIINYDEEEEKKKCEGTPLKTKLKDYVEFYEKIKDFSLTDN